jgi:formiminoglutamase
MDLRTGSVVADGKFGFAILGFCCDEGVRRNKGRQGAAAGPASIRRELGNLPCAFSPEVALVDAGDILCEDGDLAASQAALAEAVCLIRSRGLFPVVLGGGHEVALGHYNGHAKFLQQSEAVPDIGIINFDAHFDLRPSPDEGSSGTMFRQIAGETLTRGKGFNYLCLGIQRSGNTAELFKTADRLGVAYFQAGDLAARKSSVLESLDAFVEANDHLYVTVCADVFSSAVAPGVSAPQPLGLMPEDVLAYLRQIIHTGKVIGFDVAEVAPEFDRDKMTARLAKALVFAVVDEICQTRGLAR